MRVWTDCRHSRHRDASGTLWAKIERSEVKAKQSKQSGCSRRSLRDSCFVHLCTVCVSANILARHSIAAKCFLEIQTEAFDAPCDGCNWDERTQQTAAFWNVSYWKSTQTKSWSLICSFCSIPGMGNRRPEWLWHPEKIPPEMQPHRVYADQVGGENPHKIEVIDPWKLAIIRRDGWLVVGQRDKGRAICVFTCSGNSQDIWPVSIQTAVHIDSAVWSTWGAANWTHLWGGRFLRSWRSSSVIVWLPPLGSKEGVFVVT